jgi:hypothetical protein
MTEGVMLLSIMHKTAAIDQDAMKPEIMQIYKKKQRGVNTLDQLCYTYSVSRKTICWTMRMFYVMLEECSSKCIDSFHKRKPTVEEQYKAQLPDGFKS